MTFRRPFGRFRKRLTKLKLSRRHGRNRPTRKRHPRVELLGDSGWEYKVVNPDAETTEALTAKRTGKRGLGIDNPFRKQPRSLSHF